MISRTEKNKNKRKKIKNDEAKQKTIKTSKILIKISLIIISIITAIVLIMYFIGNIGLNVKEYSITYNNLPESFYGFKIVQISDIHYNTTINYQKLEKVINKINEIKPDILLFTGDLIDESKTLNEKEQTKLINLLSTIKTTTGKYAVTGEDDENDTFINIMNKAGFEIIDNKAKLIYYKDLTPIQLIGIKNKETIEEYNDSLFTIALVHKPDTITYIKENYQATSLTLAGHSHNKQINIKYIKDLIKIDGAKTYYEEYYQVDNIDLYISSGLGTTKYPFRLFNHPSISLFRLK